jgi:lipopolysaccharide transport system permease protein
VRGPTSAASGFGAVAQICRHGQLIASLIGREIAARYRGSGLGLLWPLITPLLLLAVYTLVFGTVLGARWAPDWAAAGTLELAIVLFAGLIVFQLFADVILRAPTLVVSNVSYVKKVVFPLEVLPVVALGSAVFHAAVSLFVLLAAMLAFKGYIPTTALMLPIVIAPLLLVILGLTWFLAALGVFVRDIEQVLGTLVTALMFLSPVFFSAEALPQWLRPWLALNPLALPIEQARQVLIWGRLPDLAALAAYAVLALAVAMAGLAWFQRTRKGFADVL